MKIIDCVQGSNEWLLARLGVVTASEFDSVITPKKMEASSSQSKYLAKLCAEWFIGEPIDVYKSAFMDRGTELEPQAAAAYAFEQDADVTPVGFITTDCGRIGCSPDRLVGNDGLLEIKCPAAETHMQYLLSEGDFIAAHWCQAQGELYVTGRAWVDLFSFNPAMPSVRVRVTPDKEFQAALHKCLMAFVVKVDAAKAKLAPIRPNRQPRPAVVRDSDPFATTEATEGAFL